MTRRLFGTAAAFAFAMGAPALAADMPLKARPAPPIAVAAYDWTGFYVGGHAGWGWTDKDWHIATSGLDVARYSADGFIGGVQGGYNKQIGSWVLGVEADASWGKINKGVLWVNPDVDPWIDPMTDPVHGGRVASVRTGTTVDHLGTIAARIGYAFDRVLLYGKGGGAWVHDVYRAFNANGGSETLIASASGTRWGFLAGVGIEYGLTQNWSAKLEYDYLGFGTERIVLTSIPGATPPTRAFDVRQNISLVKAGINYRFTW